MTVVSVASFIQANGHPAHGDRRWLQALTGGRGGVIPRTATFTDLKVSQRGAGANMSVDVADGQCYVTGTESSTQGVYHCDNVGVENKTITASNPTNPRRDLIVARIKDVEYGVAVTNEFLLDVIAGTPAASPVDPTVPANCIVLARVAVAANATSITNANITDLRNGYAAVTGSALIGNQQKAPTGIVPCLSAFRPTVGLFEGLTIYETDTGRIYIYNGTTWAVKKTEQVTVALVANRTVVPGSGGQIVWTMSGWAAVPAICVNILSASKLVTTLNVITTTQVNAWVYEAATGTALADSTIIYGNIIAVGVPTAGSVPTIT